MQQKLLFHMTRRFAFLHIQLSDRHSDDTGGDRFPFFQMIQASLRSPPRSIYPPSLSVIGPVGHLWFIATDLFHFRH